GGLGRAPRQHAGAPPALQMGVGRGRLSPLPKRDRRIVEKTARHYDSAVSRQKLLVLVILNWSHALLERRVLRGETKHATIGAQILLRRTVHEVIIVLVGNRAEGAGLIGTMNALAFLHVASLDHGQRLVGVKIDAPGPAIIIVDRYPNVPTEGVIAEGRNKREPRKEPLRDAPVI